MLRLSKGARKVLEVARDAGLPLYATPLYADFLVGKTDVPTPPSFTSVVGLDPLNYTASVLNPCVSIVARAPGEADRTFEAYAHRSPDSVPEYVAKWLPPVGKTWALSSGGIDLGVVMQSPLMLNVYVNGAKLPIQVPSTATREERHEAVRKHMGIWPGDWFRFGEEEDYAYDPKAPKTVDVRVAGSIGILTCRTGITDPAKDLPSALDDGAYEWSYRTSRRQWNPITVKNNVPHAAAYMGNSKVVSFTSTAKAGTEELYQAAVQALKNAGCRPVIAIDCRVYT